MIRPIYISILLSSNNLILHLIARRSHLRQGQATIMLYQIWTKNPTIREPDMPCVPAGSPRHPKHARTHGTPTLLGEWESVVNATNRLSGCRSWGNWLYGRAGTCSAKMKALDEMRGVDIRREARLLCGGPLNEQGDS